MKESKIVGLVIGTFFTSFEPKKGIWKSYFPQSLMLSWVCTHTQTHPRAFMFIHEGARECVCETLTLEFLALSFYLCNEALFFQIFLVLGVLLMSQVCFLSFSQTIKLFSWFQFVWFHWFVNFYISPDLKWQI